MDVPRTITTALEDRPVAEACCLEAGAGVGNTTAGLLEAGAKRVYAVTNDREHATTTRDRFGVETSSVPREDRLAVLQADLRALPLEDDTVDLITAHGLCNVLEPVALSAVADELRRVAAPGCHLVVDDYDPLPEGAAVRDLFAVENASAELASGRRALSFYPSTFLRSFFEGQGWAFERERTLLDPVPWTADHLTAHAGVVESNAEEDLLVDVGDSLSEAAERLAAEIEAESTGRMYSLAFQLPE